MRLSLVVAALLTVAAPRHANAAPVLDRQCCSTVDAIGTFNEVYAIQGFSVSLTGQLTAFELAIFDGVLPIVELYDGLFAPGNDLTTFTPRATVPIVNSSVALAEPPGVADGFFWFRADLSALDIAVSAGQQFSIVLRDAGPGTQGLFLGTDEPNGGVFLYAIGNILFDSAQLGGEPVDAWFRTYVEPAPPAVPEPSTLFLTVGGAAMAGLRRRLHRARQ
jgi:hypothetical protein